MGNMESMLNDTKIYVDGLAGTLERKEFKESAEYLNRIRNILDSISQYIESSLADMQKDYESEEPRERARTDAGWALEAAKKAEEKAVSLEKSAKDRGEEAKKLNKAAQEAWKEANKAKEAANKAVQAEKKASKQANKASEQADKAREAARKP